MYTRTYALVLARYCSCLTLVLACNVDVSDRVRVFLCDPGVVAGVEAGVVAGGSRVVVPVPQVRAMLRTAGTADSDFRDE